jgi:hypothetical protein
VSIFEYAEQKPDRPEGTMKNLFTGIAIVLLLLINAELSADRLYTWTDAKGNLHITQQPPPKTARTKDVMTYQSRTAAQIQKIEEDERREEIQDEATPKKERAPKPQKASAQPQQLDEADVYIDREGNLIRRAEEEKEMRDRRQEVRREYRIRRR